MGNISVIANCIWVVQNVKVTHSERVKGCEGRGLSNKQTVGPITHCNGIKSTLYSINSTMNHRRSWSFQITPLSLNTGTLFINYLMSQCHTSLEADSSFKARVCKGLWREWLSSGQHSQGYRIVAGLRQYGGTSDGTVVNFHSVKFCSTVTTHVCGTAVPWSLLRYFLSLFIRRTEGTNELGKGLERVKTNNTSQMN